MEDLYLSNDSLTLVGSLPNIDSNIMALTLFRTGIWILLAVLAMWVLRDAALKDFANLLNNQLLNRAGMLGFAVIGLGVLAMIYEKVAVRPKKAKCKVCGRPVIAGEFYCREHLRELVDRAREDMR